MIASELENIEIDWEELIECLCETKHNIHDLMGRLGDVELTATKLVDRSYTDEEKYDIMKLKFDIYDPRGDFPITVSELATISNKIESGGGADVQGYAFSHDMYAAQWFKDHNVVVAIFADGASMLHTMIATVTHTAESNRSKEAAKKIDMRLDLEAAIIASFSTVLLSIMVGNVKEDTVGAYECLIGYLKNYSVWSPHGPEGSHGLKTRV